jgi:hypothetical protein
MTDFGQSADFSSQQMEVGFSSETPVEFYHTTGRYIPQDSNFQM